MQILLTPRVGTQNLASLLPLLFALIIMVISGLYFVQAVSDSTVIAEFGSNKTNFIVHNNKIEAFRNSSDKQYKIWESETDITKIENAFVLDIDKDGNDELVALVWTNSDYFAERDYLKTLRGNQPSQHIRIYNIEPNITIKWGGSTMAQPLTDFALCGETIKFLCGYQSIYESFPDKIKHTALLWDGWSLQINDYPNFEDYKTIFVAGETMLGRNVGKTMEQYSDKTYIFGSFKDKIKNSDLAIVPLENTFVDSPLDCGAECFALQGKSDYIKILSDAGFDMAAVASNHQGDAVQSGYEATTKELMSEGVGFSGIINTSDNSLKPAISKVGDVRIGLISADDVKPEYWYKLGTSEYGTNNFSYLDNGIKKIDENKIKIIPMVKKSDDIQFLIAHLSWGEEYVTEPSDYQRELAHTLIDNGIDLVIGTHPHVVQPYEVYKGKYIFYSLGNFIFDQTQSDETRNGTALSLKINTDLTKFPEEYLADIEIHNYESCGPHQSSVNLAQQFIDGKVTLDQLKQDRGACVWYAPVEL